MRRRRAASTKEDLVGGSGRELDCRTVTKKKAKNIEFLVLGTETRSQFFRTDSESRCLERTTRKDRALGHCAKKGS